MYQYDQYDATLVRERVDQFRHQVERRLSGRLTEDQFKPLRLMNGVYLQLHAYMLRVAIPYGALNGRKMRMLGHIARRYSRGYGHFTTRTNIQYHWPPLVDIPEILSLLADVEMHAIQTSGNCIRNTTSDPYAGAALDEIEDPRPWCEIIRQWSTFHPEFSFLPRKFKIAVTGAEEDRAAIRAHDIGLKIVKNEAGEHGFQVFPGGGLGRMPRIAPLIREFLPQRELLAYLTAILRVYNMHGRRDNIHKARIKILVEMLGADEFRRQVEAEYVEIAKDGSLTLPEEEIARIRAFFPPAPSVPDEGPVTFSSDPAFALWRRRNVRAHKVKGLASVVISLKPIGGVPGDATADQMDAVADIAEQYGFDEVRVTMEQNLVLPHVRERDLEAAWRALTDVGFATPNANTATDIVSCPGLDYCSLANARSIPVAQAVAKRLDSSGLINEAGDVTIKMSGCINACGHHHIANIGVLGVDKKGEEFYQITLGGSHSDDAAIGAIVGKGLPGEDVPAAIERVLHAYLARKEGNERFLDTLRRIGEEPFKEAIYEAA
jgi:sulfite reductase (NADPH) hemoprotein beta-component